MTTSRRKLSLQRNAQQYKKPDHKQLHNNQSSTQHNLDLCHTNAFSAVYCLPRMLQARCSNFSSQVCTLRSSTLKLSVKGQQISKTPDQETGGAISCLCGNVTNITAMTHCWLCGVHGRINDVLEKRSLSVHSNVSQRM